MGALALLVIVLRLPLHKPIAGLAEKTMLNSFVDMDWIGDEYTYNFHVPSQFTQWIKVASFVLRPWWFSSYHFRGVVATDGTRQL